MDDFNQELKVGFLKEALQSILEVERCLSKLEYNHPSETEIINHILRHLHSLKGTARSVGVEEFANTIHQLENLIFKIRTTEIEAKPVVVRPLHNDIDQMIDVIKALKVDIDSVLKFQKIGKNDQDNYRTQHMVTIEPTFEKMQRIVRDTSQFLNKEINLELFGADTEIEKKVLEKIQDPLMHLVRNAVDHGIEKTEKRIENGKSQRGTIKLSAVSSASKLVVEINDDGGGIDPERLKLKAIESGLIKAENNLTDHEAFRLIFSPGFSTAEKVTDISGRGVGMDVVITNITDLGGKIVIKSKVGVGTMFRISLPLTTATLDGAAGLRDNQKIGRAA